MGGCDGFGKNMNVASSDEAASVPREVALATDLDLARVAGVLPFFFTSAIVLWGARAGSRSSGSFSSSSSSALGPAKASTDIRAW